MDTILLLKTIAICSVVYAVTWVWRVWWLRPKKLEKILRDQGFKGNPYRFFFGDQREIAQSLKEALSKPIGIDDDIAPRLLPYVIKTVNTYGKNSFTWVGRIPRLHITEPALIKEILQKYYKYYKNHHALDPATKQLLSGIGSIEGAEFNRHKKIVSPAFHMEKLKYSLPALYASSIEIVERWDKTVSEAGGKAEVNVWPDLLHLTGNVISRALFGKSYNEGKDILQHLINELAEHVVHCANSLYIPGQSTYFPNKIHRRMKEIGRIIQTSLGEIIVQRMKEMQAGEPAADDLLGVMLATNNKEMEDHGKSVGLTVEEIISECKIFYFAGQDTTSTLLNWTLFFMCRYPNWQQRAREEVLQVFGHKTPDFDGLSRLKVVPMILNEVLRVHPPISELTRETIEDTKLGPYTIPAGVQVMVPQLILHYDKEIWGEDARSFNPERFAEGIPEAAKVPVSYFPFSWGPRSCVGTNLALLNAKMAVSLMLQRFSFELSPSYVHAPMTVINLQPQHGAPLIIRKL